MIIRRSRPASNIRKLVAAAQKGNLLPVTVIATARRVGMTPEEILRNVLSKVQFAGDANAERQVREVIRWFEENKNRVVEIENRNKNSRTGRRSIGNQGAESH